MRELSDYSAATQVRNVIFDLDGTLLDSLPGIEWSLRLAFESCGMAMPPGGLRALIGPPMRDIVAQIAGVSDPPTLDRLERVFRRIYDTAGWRRTMCMRGARAILESLESRSGLALWVVTNKPALATSKILGGLELARFFRAVLCRDSRAPGYSSKAEMLRDLMERRALDREGCLMVGDTREDAAAAASVGIPCALVPHGYGAACQGALPRGGRPISGWNELLEWCTAPAAVAAREMRAVER